MSTEEDEPAAEAEPRYPLAYDANGNPLDVPAEAVAWRVRRGGGRRGRPRHVFDAETGRQLEVPLAATLDSLIDAGCASDRYLLYPVDGEGRIIPGVVAVTEVPEGVTDDDGEPQTLANTEKGTLLALVNHQLATIQRQTETLCRALEATTAGYGRVRALDAPAPVVVEQPASEPEQSSFKPEQIAEIAGVAKSIFEMLKGSGTPAAQGRP
jgi:hypothetical protein